MKKSVLILVLVFSIMLGLPCAGVYADGYKYSDEAMTHLVSLGIIDSEIKEDDYMTRGEFAQVIHNLIGDAEPVAGTYIFADLPLDHKHYEAIQRCVQRGYMGGFEGLIRPDDYVTYIEAMTVMARVLNYADYAKHNGDYTRGYYTTAKMLGLLNNTSITSSDQPMTNANAAAMIYNAMQCNINRLSQINPFYYEYASVDKTLSYDMLSLNHIKGIMNSNGYMDITGNNLYGKNLVVIDNYRFSAKNSDISFRNLIGQEVSVYYDDDYNIVSIAPTPKNTVLTVTRYDFVSLSNNVFKYVDNDVERKISVDKNVACFLNGMPVLDFDATGFSNAHFADVRLVDNNEDMIVDAIFVSVYKTFVVHSVDSEGVVSSYNNADSVDLSEENGKEIIIYNASGNIVLPDAITPNSVVSVIESDDFIYVKFVNSLVEGVVDEIDDYSVTINKLQIDVPNGTKPYFDDIKPDNYVTAFFDFDNRIVYVEKNVNLSSDIQYGFVVDCNLKDGLDKTLRVKIFTKEGKMETLKVRNKFKINGYSKTVNKLDSAPEQFFEKGEVKHSVILYKLSPEGEITEITFAASFLGEEEDGFIQTASRLKKSIVASGYDSQVFVNGSTTFFCVPSSDFSNEEDYEIMLRSEIPTTAQHTVDAYHFSKNNGYADVVVMYGKSSPINYNTKLSVITKISEGLDNNGEKVLKVSHFVDSSVVSGVAKKADIITKVKDYKPGDSVRISTLDGEIVACEKIYDYDDKKFTKSSKGGEEPTSSLYNKEGYVAFTDSTLLRINTEKTKITTSDILKLDGFVFSSAKILVVENSQRGVDVKKVNAYDVKVGDHIVIQARSGTLKYVIIYKDL